MAARTASSAGIDLPQVNEILQLADTILARSRDHSFVQKVTILRGYLEMHHRFPGNDYRDKLSKALADVTAVVNSGIQERRSV